MAMSKSQKSYVEDMLQCSVCLDRVTNAQTLKQCFHSYCKHCVDQLIDRQNNHPPGVKCPVCATFSAKGEIRSNFFINDLADLHRNLPGQLLCGQCSDDSEPSEASWKCLDCKMYLCKACQSSHLKIKLLQGHRVLPLTEETEMVMDKLVFCSIHMDKPVEFNCKTCKIPVCIKCKITKHDDHKLETVEETLDRLIPEIEANTKHIEDKVDAISHSIDKIENKITETNKLFNNYQKQVDKEAEKRIQDIKTTQKQIKESLNKQKLEELGKLESVKEQLQKRKNQQENLHKVVRTSLERARHATLLTELLQGGLCEKIESEMQKKDETNSVIVSAPNFDPQALKWNKFNSEGLLGKLVFSVINFMYSMGCFVKSGSHVCDLSFKDYFSNQLTKSTEMNMSDFSFRIAEIQGEMWVPLYYKNIVKIYNKSTQHVQTFNLKNPTSVVEAFNSQVFISSYTDGLHVMCDKNDKLHKLCDGNFSCVCTYGDKVYALKYSEQVLKEFCVSGRSKISEPLNWTQYKSIHVSNYENASQMDTIVVTQCNKQLQFYISSCIGHTIYQYNEEGVLIKQYGSKNEVGIGKLLYPFLCCIDKDSVLLVADSNNKKTKLLDTVSGEWSLTPINIDDYFRDVQIDSDGSMWIQQGKKIFKYLKTL